MPRKVKEPEPEPVDASGWILDNPYAEFVLMNQAEIKYMCMLGYTYMHGSKVFATIGDKAPFSYKFASMIMACTGGGILVPIFINKIPVPLSQDAYPIAILVSFFLHQYFPVLREVLTLSKLFKAAVIFLYECLRAVVVCKFTLASAEAIPASELSFPLFGPIFCGTISGCGGMFLPLDKGLKPIKEHGLAPPMFSAFVGTTFLHLFLNTSLSDGVKDAKMKGQVIVSTWFILYGLYKADILKLPMAGKEIKKEKTN